MSHAAGLSPIVALVVAIFALGGASLALVGSIGLLRLQTFYERIHPPTMGTTLGTASTLVASMVLFSALEARPVVHEVAIAVFMVVTTPVTFMLLVRAAAHRDGIARSAAEDPAKAARADDTRHGSPS
jgi:multicomponent K+:H+ antiporter subunit G